MCVCVCLCVCVCVCAYTGTYIHRNKITNKKIFFIQRPKLLNKYFLVDIKYYRLYFYPFFFVCHAGLRFLYPLLFTRGKPNLYLVYSLKFIRFAILSCRIVGKPV